MHSPNKRILLVEDDDDIREILPLLLTDYEMTVARTCADGLRLASSHRFDLYVVDNRLPDGMGVELCRQIRAFDAEAPVLFCSADVFEADRSQALAAGAQGYLAKPFDFVDLERLISAQLQAGAMVKCDSAGLAMQAH